MRQFSRRDVLRASTAIAASGAFASVTSAAPPASAVTPELIAAAKKEGKVVYYTSIDLPVAESKDLQQRERFLRLLVGRDVLHHRPRLAVLRDDERLALLGELADQLRGVRLDVANGLNPRRIFQWCLRVGLNLVRIQSSRNPREHLPPNKGGGEPSIEDREADSVRLAVA